MVEMPDPALNGIQQGGVMRTKFLVRGLWLLAFLLGGRSVTHAYDWPLGKWGNVNVRGEITYALKVRTEHPYPRFVDPRSAYYSKGDAAFSKWDLANNNLIGIWEVLAESEHVNFFGRVLGTLDFAYFDEEKFNSEIRRHAAYNVTDGLEFYLEGRDGGFTTRWGRQIIQWGESTAPIWAPGVNVVSPFFVQRVNSAGYTFRSWQVPTFMGWALYESSKAVSFQLVWQPDFDPRFFMPVAGTYQSPSDFFGFGVTSDFVEDLRPRDWKDQQQFGGAVRLVASRLNMLELGFYYYHYRSRWPMLNMPEEFPPKIYIEWPELDMIGMSFSQAIQSWGLNVQVGGELAYRPNEPLQLESVQSPFMASVSGLEKGVAGYERSRTLSWDINGMKMMTDVLAFTPWTFQFTPLVEFYGKIQLDDEGSKMFMDPRFTAYYMLQLPLATSDMIENTRVNLTFSAMGGMHKEKNRVHALSFTAGGKYGDSWEVLFGYNLSLGSPEQDPQGQWMWDRDNFVFKLTYYFI